MQLNNKAVQNNANSLETNVNVSDAQREADSFFVEAALTRSAFWPTLYKRDHFMEQSEEYPEAMNTLAMARLEWILRQGRAALSDSITAEEFRTLCDVFNHDLATPDEIEDMAGAVAESYGIEYEGYEKTPLGPLLNKLLNFSPIQKLALRDLVQRFWYPINKPVKSFESFLEQNGVTAAKAG